MKVIAMPREVKILCNSVAVVTVRMVDGAPEYLLLRRASRYLHGEWCQVAGAVESGETAWQAGLRELLEETGLEPLAYYSADRMEQIYRPDWDAIVLAPLFLAFVSPVATARLNDEHSEYRWCTRDEALTLLRFFNMRANVQHVHTEFIERAPNEQLRLAP
jgi:dATP pyrophosphohydrolase